MTDDPTAVAVPLGAEDHRRLLRLLGTLAERLGPLPGPEGARYADGPELLGAALVLAEGDPVVLDALAVEIRRRRLRRAARGELLAVCGALEGVAARLEPVAAREEAERLARDLREVTVAVALQEEAGEIARRLLLGTHRLTHLAEQGGPWAPTLQDLAGTLDDLHDALRPPT
ncbi:hypothetical protein [Actinomycetospora sp. TBRC 11914]|uniref:hypothetical protein n=1 Tax=Actinomycetospora sp. TBRC 11914 TaxID=2729387 RepID=UPI00145E02DD|nr:hypothetical protein [Actinomycetospora sp. TBRC 11914]NMO93886.1 hypothetical protein [Actinomycetospora sp. TBRC 11914]